MTTNKEIITLVEELMALWVHQMDRVFKPWLEDKSADLALAIGHYNTIRREIMEGKDV